MFNFASNTTKILKEKLSNYRDTTKAQSWLNKNLYRINQLFTNTRLKEIVFEPFKEVFRKPANTIDENIYSIITQVAIINAVLAGLPGKMGVGVYVSIAMEGYMAFMIARHVGIKVKAISDIWKYFGILASSVGLILYGFRILLGIAFSIFSVIPFVNPLIFAEIFVTDFVGIIFWVGFNEASRTGSFAIPKRLLREIMSRSKGLLKQQSKLLKNVLSVKNLKLVGLRLSAYLRGDFPVNMRIINGETFATAAVAYLLSGQYDKLNGPMGDVFIDAIRMRWSSQFAPDTSIEEIAERFSEYDSNQIVGVINSIKGKMFEILVTEKENLDGDGWYTVMHEDESFPGSDIILTNSETGEQIEISLKAVAENNSETIDYALARYPDIPIMTTEEAAQLYAEDDRVFSAQISNEDLETISADNFEDLIKTIKPIDEHQVVFRGAVVGMTAALWPFVIAFLRKRITKEQLEKAFKQVLGKSGVKLASNIAYATLFGPLFAWFLLAKGVKGWVVMAEPRKKYLMEMRNKT